MASAVALGVDTKKPGILMLAWKSREIVDSSGVDYRGIGESLGGYTLIVDHSTDPPNCVGWCERIALEVPLILLPPSPAVFLTFLSALAREEGRLLERSIVMGARIHSWSKGRTRLKPRCSGHGRAVHNRVLMISHESIIC